MVKLFFFHRVGLGTESCDPKKQKPPPTASNTRELEKQPKTGPGGKRTN